MLRNVSSTVKYRIESCCVVYRVPFHLRLAYGQAPISKLPKFPCIVPVSWLIFGRALPGFGDPRSYPIVATYRYILKSYHINIFKPLSNHFQPLLNIYRTTIERLSEFIEHLSNIYHYQTSIKLLLNIIEPLLNHIEYLSNVYWTTSNIYRTSIIIKLLLNIYQILIVRY